MTCCDSCADTGSCADRKRLAAQQGRFRALVTTMRGEVGAAAGGAAGASAGSSVGPVGTYAGGVGGAAAGSGLENLLGGKSDRCEEPACSFPTVETWAAEARRRGASSAAIDGELAKINAQFEGVIAQQPSIVREDFRSALDRSIPNLQNGSLRRHTQATALAALVASLPIPRLNESTRRWLYVATADQIAGDAGGPAYQAKAEHAAQLQRDNERTYDWLKVGLGVVGASIIGGGIWYFKTRKKKKNGKATRRR